MTGDSGSDTLSSRTLTPTAAPTPTKARGRVTKACERCHSRKVKCDGAHPCSRCAKSSMECVFDVNPRRRRPRRKKHEIALELQGKEPSGNGVIKGLSQVPLSKKSKVKKQIVKIANGTTVPQFKSKSPVELISMLLKNNAVETHAHEFTNLSQPSLSIFSPRGIRWVVGQLKLEPEYEQKVLRALHIAVHLFQKSSIESVSNWIKVVPHFEQLPHRELCLDLIHEYFEHPLPYSDIITEDVVETYLCRYFDPTNFPGGTLNYSEMLILDMIIVHGLFNQLCNEEVPRLAKRHNMTREAFRCWMMKLVSNANFLYQRICITGDGLTGVQGLLLLVQLCHVLPQAKSSSYMIISTTVRLAQELGLHRRELYYGIPFKDVGQRLSLWWGCYWFDKIHCLVSGKPPIINDADVSVIYPIDFLKTAIYLDDVNVSLQDVFNTLCLLVKTPSGSVILSDITSINLADYSQLKIDKVVNGLLPLYKDDILGLTNFYLIDLATIFSKVFEKLLSPGVTSRHLNKPDIEATVRELDLELMRWKNRVPAVIRPGNAIDLSGFKDQGKDQYLEVVNLHMSYFAAVTFLSRSFSHSYKMHGFNECKTGPTTIQSLSGSSAADAALHNLKLSREFFSGGFRYLSRIMVHPMTSVVSLFTYCLKNPDDPDLQEYIEYVIITIRLLFELKEDYIVDLWPQYHMINGFFSLIVVILAGFYQRTHNVDKISNDEELNEYCKRTKISITESRLFERKIEKGDLVNGFYTLNRASNILDPKFCAQQTDADLALSIAELPIDFGLPEINDPLHLLKNFDILPHQTMPVPPEFNNPNFVPSLSESSTVPGGNVGDAGGGDTGNGLLVNDVNYFALDDHFEFPENSTYLYQSIFNLPNSVIGDQFDFYTAGTKIPDFKFE